MDFGKQPAFKSLEDEIEYWKDMANTCLNDKRQLQKEYDDYTEQSQQVEKELETALEQTEKSNKTLRAERIKLQNEIESLKSRLEQSSREINSLQNEMSTLKNDYQTHMDYIRELEQKNDDLERAQRVVIESLAATESTLNTAIERNALLESEVDEKEQLQMKFQRLLDETRDLKEDITVKERKNVPDNERVLKSENSTTIDSNRLLTDKEPARPQSPTKQPTLNGSTPMTPSARHSALNLVSDILRKMGTLEAKVQTCRQRQYSQSLEHRYRRQNRLSSNANGADSPVQSGVLQRDL